VYRLHLQEAYYNNHLIGDTHVEIVPQVNPSSEDVQANDKNNQTYI